METGLADESIDVVLLYDLFHHISEPDMVLEELHRVLKQEGVLSVSDHHLQEEAIGAGITRSGRFGLLRKGPLAHSFVKRLAAG